MVREAIRTYPPMGGLWHSIAVGSFGSAHPKGGQAYPPARQTRQQPNKLVTRRQAHPRPEGDRVRSAVDQVRKLED